MPNPFVVTSRNPIPHNASALTILQRSTQFTAGIQPLGGYNLSGMPGIASGPLSASVGALGVPNLPILSIQPIPDLGRNPSALKILAATTQFQNQITPVGGSTLPGFPIIDFSPHPMAMDFIGHTNALINSIMPLQAGIFSQGSFFPAAQGGGLFYPPPAIQPPLDVAPFGASYYTTPANSILGHFNWSAFNAI
jgi:hypothetical protein